MRELQRLMKCWLCLNKGNIYKGVSRSCPIENGDNKNKDTFIDAVKDEKIILRKER